MPNSGSDCDNCRWYNEKTYFEKRKIMMKILKIIEIINALLPSLMEMVKMQSNTKFLKKANIKKIDELMKKNENEFKKI